MLPYLSIKAILYQLWATPFIKYSFASVVVLHHFDTKRTIFSSKLCQSQPGFLLVKYFFAFLCVVSFTRTIFFNNQKVIYWILCPGTVNYIKLFCRPSFPSQILLQYLCVCLGYVSSWMICFVSIFNEDLAR